MVEEFLANGDRVIATGRSLTHRKEIFASLRELAGDRLVERDLDVTSPDQRDAFAKFCDETGIDVLVNNAGAGLFGAAEDCHEHQIREQFELNFFGTVFLTRRLLPALRKSRGRVFNVASVFGFMGFPLAGTYCASKFAIEGWSESLSYEVRPHGVHICLIEPGGYQTDFTASQSWGDGAGLESSPYTNQTKAYQALREKEAKKPATQDPRDVARGVVRLSNRRCPPLRKHFGKDATAAYWSRRLLPRPFYNWLFHFAFARMFPVR